LTPGPASKPKPKPEANPKLEPTATPEAAPRLKPKLKAKPKLKPKPEAKPEPRPELEAMAAFAGDDGVAIGRGDLARELEDAIEFDKTYEAVDAMKKRSIHVATSYDDFRNRVACSTLKPVSSKELGALREGRRGWDHTAAARASKASRTPTLKKKSGKKKKKRTMAKGVPTEAPTTSMEFLRDWNRRCKTQPERMAYLRLVGPSGAASLFKSDMDAALLGEVLQVLHECFCAGTDAENQTPDAQQQSAPETAAESEPNPKPEPNPSPSPDANHSPDAGADAAVEGEEGGEGEAADEPLAAWLAALAQTGRFALNVNFLSAAELETARAMLEACGDDEGVAAFRDATAR